MLQDHVTDRAMAEIIAKVTKLTSRELRRMSNMALIASEIVHARETGKVYPAPSPTDG